LRLDAALRDAEESPDAAGLRGCIKAIVVGSRPASIERRVEERATTAIDIAGCDTVIARGSRV
jgi:hypothetical protein